MKSFDEWFVEFGMERNNFSSTDEKHWFKHNVKAGYKAGAQSRQSEIDELKKSLDAKSKQFLEGVSHYEYQKEIADELKKRISEALKELEYINFYKTQNSNNAIKILKGENHES